LAVIVTLLVWSALRLRPKAEKVRERLKGHLGVLIPGSHLERCWFGVVSIGAGISEELVFRGFLIYYLGLYLPQINTWEKVVLTAVIFGVAHLYQGWQGIMGASILGLIAAGIYVISGSLLVPMVLHAVIDWRLLLMLPPDPLQGEMVATKA
jgi:membrane protease YdiL (CAAX protease family)